MRSGVARVGQQLIAGYRSAGHQVEVVERRDVGETSIGEVRLSGLPFFWRRVAKRLEGCDLVHVHGPAPTFADAFLLGCALRRRRRPPMLYSHNFEVHFPGPLAPLARVYERATLRLAARVASRIVVSTEQFRARLPDPSRAVVVPWGCDHRPLAARSDAVDPKGTNEPDDALGARPAGRARDLRVLFVGQMRPYKGVPVLLEALRGLEGVTAKLAGGGRRLHAYRRLLQRSPEGPRDSVDQGSVELLGPVDDERLDALLAWADVIVLPSISRQEAFGLVLVEGMRAGCVPVASRLPGVEEVVGDAGILVAPGDPASLRDALSALRDDRDRLARLAARATAVAAEWTWARTVARHLELARDLVEERSSAGDAQRAAS